MDAGGACRAAAARTLIRDTAPVEVDDGDAQFLAWSADRADPLGFLLSVLHLENRGELVDARRELLKRLYVAKHLNMAWVVDRIRRRVDRGAPELDLVKLENHLFVVSKVLCANARELRRAYDAYTQHPEAKTDPFLALVKGLPPEDPGDGVEYCARVVCVGVDAAYRILQQRSASAGPRA